MAMRASTELVVLGIRVLMRRHIDAALNRASLSIMISLPSSVKARPTFFNSPQKIPRSPIRDLPKFLLI
jgi:hypothetical protein